MSTSNSALRGRSALRAGFRRSLAVAAAAFGLVAVAAGPAAAHGGHGQLVVHDLSATGMDVDVAVGLTWSDDGHDATGATVTLTAVGPDGASLVPVSLAETSQEGRYEGTVAVTGPGDWTFRVTAVEPPATIEQVLTIAAPATTVTTAPTTTTEAPTTTTEAPAATDSASAVTTSSDDGGGGGLGAAGVAIIVALIAVVGIAVVRFQRSGKRFGADS